MRSLLFLTLNLVTPSVRADDLQSLAKNVVTELGQRKFADVTARFDETMRKGLSTAKLEETWNGLLNASGALKTIQRSKMETIGNYQVATVTTEFEQGIFDMQISFDAKHQIAGFFIKHSSDSAAAWTPPAYAGAVDEKPITVGSFNLRGFLTLPKSGKGLPAIVLVHGSGPNDADETIGANKVFKDLAFGLASRGVAVLRYNKRTNQSPNARSSKDYTVKDEVIDDALAAVTMLRTQPNVDPHRIWVLGHSLGGMLAPRIAAADAQIAGIVSLAGATRPLEELVVEQIKYLMPNDAKMNAVAQKFFDTVRDPKLTSQTTVDLLGAFLPGSYFLDLRGYRPATVAGRLKQPMLILQGGLDYQVTVADFDGWKRALGSHANVKLKLYPALNHLFITGTSPSKPSEYETPGHVAQEVIEDIASFVTASHTAMR